MNEFTKVLEPNNIESRPPMSGDFTLHDIADIFEYIIVGDLKNTKDIHAGITDQQRESALSKFKEFFFAI